MLIGPCVHSIRGLKIHEQVALNEVLEANTFHLEPISASSFFLQGGDHVEVPPIDPERESPHGF